MRLSCALLRRGTRGPGEPARAGAAIDSHGRVKSRATYVYDVIPVHGVGVELHVEHDGEPVPPEVRRKQEQKLDERRRESPAQAAQRLAREKHDRAFLQRDPGRLRFPDRRRGASAHRSGLGRKSHPASGFQPRSRYAHVFPKLQGTLWIANFRKGENAVAAAR